MKTSKNGIKLLKSLEGKSNKAYQLKDGGITIGYGSYYSFNSFEVKTGIIKKDTYWSDKKCEEELMKEVSRIEKYLNKILPFKATQNQFDALISYAYNRGCGGLLALLKAGKGDCVETGLLMVELWGTNKNYKASLINRRLKEMNTYFKNYIPSYKSINKNSSKTSIKWLQYKLNVAIDGIYGTKTTKRVNEYLRINKAKTINRKEIKKISNYSI